MIYIFEDVHALDLEPLALTRATFELRCGAFTHLERIKRTVEGGTIALIVRPELAKLVQERYPDYPVNPDNIAAGIWLNGAALWDESCFIPLRTAGARMAVEGRLVGANFTASEGQEFAGMPGPGTQTAYSSNVSAAATLLPYLWDHCQHNSGQLQHDFSIYFKGSAATMLPAGLQEVGDGGIFLGKDTTIDPYVVIDTRNGPVIIDNKVHIGSYAIIEGPAYIGPKSSIWPHSIIKNVSLGPVCRVSGQLTNVILQGFTNKQHYGFLGDAYIGAWVNLGAGTTNSNLKNNYGHVSVHVNGNLVETGSQFIGLYMGDYSKSAIGTLFPTGSTVGPGANVFGTTTPAKATPAFAWGDTAQRYTLDKFLTAAVTARQRRGHDLSPTEREMLTRLHQSTA